MPRISFDSAKDYIDGLEDTVTEVLRLGRGQTLDVDLVVGEKTIPITFNTSDLYITHIDGASFDSPDYTHECFRLNKVEIAGWKVVDAVSSAKGSMDGSYRDIFIISIAEAMRFPMVAYMIAYSLENQAETFESGDLGFIQEWRKMSDTLRATGRSDMNMCSLLKVKGDGAGGGDLMEGGNCRLRVYEWMRRRFAIANFVTKSEIDSQLRLLPTMWQNLRSIRA